jgi:hypothetical protein
MEAGQAQIARGEYVLLDDLKHEMGRPPKQYSGESASSKSLPESVGGWTRRFSKWRKILVRFSSSLK